MTVGIKSILDIDENVLKREFLLYDKLFIDGLEDINSAISLNIQSGESGLGIVLAGIYRKALSNPEFYNYISDKLRIIKKISNLDFIIDYTSLHDRDNIAPHIGFRKAIDDTGISPTDLLERFDLNKLMNVQHFSARLKKEKISKTFGSEVVPVPGYLKPVDKNGVKADVYNVVFDKFPVIDSDTEWSQLHEFKSGYKFERLGLKNWINSVSKEGFNKNEIADKLEYELEELRKRLDIHNIRYSSSTLKIILISTAEITKYLLLEEYDKAFNKLINITEMKSSLLADELDMPNKELAYLINVRKVFN